MIDAYDIIETIKMIEEEHLDIRTVTMGISLVDCIRGSIKEKVQGSRFLNVVLDQ